MQLGACSVDQGGIKKHINNIKHSDDENRSQKQLLLPHKLLGPVKIIENKFQINGFNLMNAIMSTIFPPPEESLKWSII